MEKQESKLGYRIVLFPHPYVGHATPMLNLGNALYSKGFSITIIQTTFNPSNPTAFPNFTFHCIEEAPLSSEALASSSDPWETITILNRTFSGTFRNSLSEILEDGSEEEEPVACLISDPLWDFPGRVADEFNLPRLALRTGGLLAFVVYASLPLLQKKGYFSLPESEQEAAVLEFPPLKVKDLPPEANHDTIASLAKEAKSYHLGFICNTFKELEGSFLDQFSISLPCIPIFPIGPLHKYPSTHTDKKLNEDHRSMITWLDTQAPNSVLYVSFGTIAAISKEQFTEIAWGLAKSKQPFLWVVRSKLITGSDTNNDVFPEDFLQTINGRGYIVSWAPQREVLAHPSVGGFWTHCGWNSTMESICEGVPMICLPFLGDQKMNTRHVTEVCRIGLPLEREPKRQEIEWAIKRLMVEKEGEEMRERIASLKVKAHTCLIEGGSSFEALDQLTSHILSIKCAEKPKRQ